MNLGSGSELGVYKRWVSNPRFWTSDLSQAMTMKLTTYGYTIFDFRPAVFQWWIIF